MSESSLAPLAEALAAAAAQVAQVAAGRRFAPGGRRDSGAAVADLCFGTLRRYGRSQAIVAALSRRPGSADPATDALLWCALYALDSGRYADYAVVDQAAQACTLLRKANAKGYVNAILRNFLRSRKQIEAKLASDPVALHQHPAWWIDRVRAAYPEGWTDVLAAGNTHPPMCLRVNRRRATPEAYLQRLQEEGIAARALSSDGLLLERPVPVERLPGFADGMVSVQDAGAQQAARLIGLLPGMRVLDACAAPGGKSAHLLETEAIDLTSMDVDPARCADVQRTLDRLGLTARVLAADCEATGDWWDGRPFERILADVPCSASGVARRHPDIKWLRRESDIAAFAARQSRILDALWPVLAPGGKLLYVTCSVFPEENGTVVDAFVARTPGVARAVLPGSAPAQWLPSAEHDGFYFALLEKPA